MIRYTARRLALIPFVLLGMVFLTFFVSQLVPVDPVAYFIGARQAAAPADEAEIVAAAKAKWGWDKPIPERFAIYTVNLLHGDLGESSSSRRPVAADLAEYLPATLELVLFTLALALLIAIPLGVLAAARQGGLFDGLFNVVSAIAISTPTFLAALLALTVFYKNLGWAAGQGRLDILMEEPPRVTGMITLDSLIAGRWDSLVNGLHHLALPAGILAVLIGLYFARIVRAEMLRALASDYVRTARGKGLPEAAIRYGHALRNAIVPTITLSGLSFGSLLTGAIVVESITGWPGLGSYTFRVTTRLDLPAIAGVALTVGIIYMFANLIVDLLYAAVDPRVRVR